jgi:GT2 family glycosyltransferase
VPQVTVIVPLFNGIDFLPTFFASLRGALPGGTQLILVDDASSQPVWDTVPEFSGVESVVRLQNDHNLGYSAAVNRAFAQTTGDLVVQLNTDLVLEPNCITAMVDLIAQEPRAGIAGSKLIYPTTGLVQHVGMAFGNHTKPHIFSELPASHPLCSRTREVQVVTGATVAMTRAVLDRLGPLEERYFNHNEDIEHCLIARKHGLRNFMCAESVAHHRESKSGPARFARMASSEALFWARWGSSFDVDLGDFVDEALDHLLGLGSGLAETPFQVLDLSRGADQPIVLECIRRRWPGVDVRTVRQMNNPLGRLELPLVLPHWLMFEPVPFIYLVDGYRELEDNVLWFQTRTGIVRDELVVDLTGAALPTSEITR